MLNPVDKYSLCILVAAPVAFAALELLADEVATPDVEAARATAAATLQIIHEILEEGEK